MILIANDAGSRELLPHLSKRAPCMLWDMEFSDFYYDGFGPGDKIVTTGVERKTWPDFLHSFESGRLQAHQIPGLVRNFDRRYLLLEGLTKPGPGGLMQIARGRGNWEMLASQDNPRRGWTISQIRGILAELEEMGQVRLAFTINQVDTCDWLAVNYEWRQKSWDSHGVFKVIKDVPASNDPDPSSYGAGRAVDMLELTRQPSLVRRMAAQILGVGWEKSKLIEQEFRTVRAMAAAGVADWMRIKGIGKSIAQRTVRAINEGGLEREELTKK